MINFSLNSLRLNAAAIAARSNETDFEVRSVHPNYEYTTDHHRTDTVIGYSIELAGVRGYSVDLKIPLNSANTKLTERISEALAKDLSVRIQPIGLSLKAYASINQATGKLNAGVSAKADSFEIAKIENPSDVIEM